MCQYLYYYLSVEKSIVKFEVVKSYFMRIVTLPLKKNVTILAKLHLINIFGLLDSKANKFENNEVHFYTSSA